MIDTGFNGWLSTPNSIIAALDLPWLRRSTSEFADGSLRLFNVHHGAVLWDGRERRIQVDAAETAPMVGMCMLEGFEFNMRVRDGGTVTIKRLPRR